MCVGTTYMSSSSSRFIVDSLSIVDGGGDRDGGGVAGTCGARLINVGRRIGLRCRCLVLFGFARGAGMGMGAGAGAGAGC